ncbi:MAG: hypothetical protein ACI87J_002135 [Colwellia sp.]|jgi:hypothetical protein
MCSLVTLSKDYSTKSKRLLDNEGDCSEKPHDIGLALYKQTLALYRKYSKMW